MDLLERPKASHRCIRAIQTRANEIADSDSASYRNLLRRDDIDDPAVLPEKLGEYCGHYSMVVFTDIRRSSIAGLARDVIDDPGQFPLLRTDDARISFFRSFAFG